jgi:histidine ammonia-lyase
VIPDQGVISIDALDAVDLDLAARVAGGRCRLAIAPPLLDRIAAGRLRYERFLARQQSYVYGTTTAPGNRAKRQLAPADSASQGSTLGGFIALRPGFSQSMMPARTVRMALLARLTNAFTGQGKLTAKTAKAICDLVIEAPPPVPLGGQTGPGEVMALGWLLAPIGDLPLGIGEAMALVNGSPFATAMAADVALTSRRQLDLAHRVFALSAEAARAPRGHFDPRLARAWPDPFYAQALHTLDSLLDGGADERLGHQAPVAWRITPNILAAALRASADAAAAAELSLRSLKDNPTFLTGETEDQDVVFSSGGYQDQGAGRAIDTVNAAWCDLAVLAYRQVAKLVGGVDLGLPHLLTRTAADGVGTEYLVWTLTSSLARLRQAAVPAGLDLSLEDPGGNQSDVAQPAFVAYARHLDAAAALNECLAALLVASRLALDIRGDGVPQPLLAFLDEFGWPRGADEGTAAASGAPLRAVAERFQRYIEPG